MCGYRESGKYQRTHEEPIQRYGPITFGLKEFV